MLPDYNPETYKSRDFYERLGLTRYMSVTPDRVDAACAVRMEWWHSMRANPKWSPQIAAAQKALLEAKEALRNPSSKADYDANKDAGLAQHNILLLGGPGAGKSALLGAIYDVAMRDGALDPFAVRFTPDTRSNVLTNLKSLRAFCNPDHPNRSRVLQREANVPDTYRPYSMLLSLRGRDKAELTFIDTAGEDLAQAMNPGSSLSEQMTKASAAILVVDAVALFHQHALEDSGLHRNARRNMPENVEAVVQEWVAAEPDAPRLFVIAVMKIESFIYDRRTGRERQRQRDEIVRRVQELYHNSIAYLESQAKNCVITVCPIETCGNLYLDQAWEPTTTNGQYPAEEWDLLVDEYNLPDGRKRYRPADCELPLLAVLSFFLTLIQHTDSGSSRDTAPSESDGLWTFDGLIGQLAPQHRAVYDRVTQMVPQEWLRIAKQLVESGLETANQCRYLVQFVAELGGWVQEDVRRAIRALSTRLKPLPVRGNRRWLTT